MRHHQALFERLQKHTGMFLSSETFEAVAAFVLGYDAAYEGGVLVGFREWLAVKLGDGANLAWPALVLLATFPDVVRPEDFVKNSSVEQRMAIDMLFTLIYEFDSVVTKRDGLRCVLVAYAEKFEREQSSDPISHS